MRALVLTSLFTFAACVTPSSASSAQSAPKPPPDGMCLAGRDGQTACGYKCLEGTDGRALCAETKAGQCILGGDGRVACGLSCATGSDGMVVCTEVPGRTCTAEDGVHAQCR